MEKKKKTYLLIGLGMVVLTGGAAAWYLSGRNGRTGRKSSDLAFLEQEATSQFKLPSPPSKPSNSSSSPSTSGKTKTGFPLKRGSRGTKVKQLQQALIKRYGKGVLPKWGADGSWGSELDKALSSNNHPTIVTESLFKQFVGSSSGGSLSAAGAKKIAANLRVAILDNDFPMALRVVGRIKNTSAYQKVSPIFKKKEFGAISYTIVNALLVKFRTASQKKQLNEQFYRIGLKNDGSKWSLSGIEKSDQIISTKRSRVWNLRGNSIIVKANTLLGEPISDTAGVTLFRTLDHKELFINTENVRHV